MLTGLMTIWRALQAGVIVACLFGFGAVAYGLHDLFTISDEERLAHDLRLLPPGLSVTTRLYSNTNFGGFGPGSNEAGLIVFELPETLSAMLKIEGINALKTATAMPDTPPDRRIQWREAPLDQTLPDWKCGGERPSPCAGIVGFATHYWHLTRPLPEDLVQLVDNALRTRGNFYGFYRGGVIAIVPEAERIVFAFN